MRRNKRKTNDTSSTLNISELADKFTIPSNKEQIDELVRKNAELSTVILDLKKKIEDRDQIVSHLEMLLKASVPMIVSEPNEKEIAEIQLEKLKQKALGQELTLEEARKFEIFSKVKLNVETAEKSKPKQRTVVALPTDESKLLQIASTSVLKDKIVPENE